MPLERDLFSLAKGNHHSPQLDGMPNLSHPTMVAYFLVCSHQHWWRKVNGTGFFCCWITRQHILVHFAHLLLSLIGADQVIQIN
jgi:hypothetical protein